MPEYKILSNTVWMMASTLVNTGANFLIFIVIARYLGATEFGSFSYVFALASLFSMMGQMGLDGLLSRELVEERDRQPEILGTAGIIRLAGYSLGALLTLGYGFALPSHSPLEQQMFAVAALFVFSNVLTALPENWLRAMSEAKAAAKARIWANLIGGGLKVLVVVLGGGALAVSFVHLGSLLLTAGLLQAYYISCGGPAVGSWRPSRARARLLLSESWRLFVSALLWVAYMRIDLVLLRQISGPEIVGQYAVATRLAEVTYALPSALIVTTFPAIMAARGRNAEEYKGKLQDLLHVMAISGLLVTLICCLFSIFAIQPLFGEEFSSSARISFVYTLSTPFFFMHYVTSRWIIIERKTLFGMINDIIGVLMKASLSLVLIPVFGAVGAASGTIISYATLAWFSLLFAPGGKPLFRMMSFALFTPWRGIPVLQRNLKSRRSS